jgi:alpha-glucosidase
MTAQNLCDAKTSYAGEWNVDEKLDSLNALGIEHQSDDHNMEELTPFKNEKIWWKSRYYLAFIKKR